MSSPTDHALIQKVLRRLIPFCILCYLLNYIDRVNIGVAKLKMVETLPGFTEQVYATGAAIFFLGYCLFELPSNLIQEKVGPRRWIARIMISWGIISMCFMFVQGKWSYYWLRFLLGFAEAGFFPGMILYLSYWIPHRYRARAAAAFLTSTAISGVIGNPLGGLIQYATESAPLGLQSWKWMFLLEGIPSVILGIVTLYFLTDHPKNAQWLLPEERTRLAKIIADERENHPQHNASALLDALKSKYTWLLSLLYGLIIFSFYMINFFTTTILKTSLKSSVAPATPGYLLDLYVCLLSAIPFGAAAVGMVLIGGHSDKHNERKFHLAFACALTTLGLLLAAFSPRIAQGGTGTTLTIAGLSIGAVGAFGIFGPFWALPPQLMTGTAAAAAFAMINSVGNFIGGFLAPMCQSRWPQEIALLIAAFLACGAMVLALLAPLPQPELREYPVGNQTDTEKISALDAARH